MLVNLKIVEQKKSIEEKKKRRKRRRRKRGELHQVEIQVHTKDAEHWGKGSCVNEHTFVT